MDMELMEQGFPRVNGDISGVFGVCRCKAG